MNSKWQIHRVGLVDFWYYDEEEFYFLDGRMLLRGANGSGKSVTMQSFIPLLLDGNMRPERLDPFGSRARKMENYLLEEGDEREERTGYLYMEMKRTESDEYLTVGIGMRARRSKKLESWYFCITDGRRIGQDLFLYKDVQNKITCTKQELRNRIGDGGKVMDTQGEYAACVNRLLFGFETQEEYRELLELLIQLRTPKLSKDFKPTVINEILGSSLQTLSEDDLRPMSEAIENMDSLKTNLDTLNDSVRAAKQIERVYDQYNQIVLYDKALLFTKAIQECREFEKRAEDLDRRIAEGREMLRKEEQHYQDLKQEEQVLAKERESLAASDAAKLKEQEVKTVSELEERRREVREKERQENDKREKQLDTERRIREQSERNEMIWDEIDGYLEEMEETMEEVSFDEFSFLKKELCEAPNQPYSFQGHNQLLDDYVQKVEAGKAVLTEEKNIKERYSRFLKELDEYHEERNQAEKELLQYENLLHETKAELTEDIYRWERDNQELHLNPETLQEISRSVEAYQMGMDYSEIRDLAKQFFYQKEGELSDTGNQARQMLKETAEKEREAKEELEQWQNQKDPEPEQPEAVRENRRILQEKGIPYLQFYKTVDFEQSLDEEQISHLEEALLQMGILDALIVPAEYREQIYELDPGICDRYIFSDVTRVQNNLTQVLEVDNGEDDILFYQKISRILSAIGYVGGEGQTGEEDCASQVDENGNYRIGVLEGTITKTYEARFIGVRARENYRRQKIEELEIMCRELEEETGRWKNLLESTKQREEILRREWKAFPGDQDLKVAAKSYTQREYALELLGEQIRRQEERVEQERKQLDEVRLQAREVCQKCYLSPRLDVFERALEALHMYKENLTKLQIAHGSYLNGIREAESKQEYLEELMQDLDDIRYDLNRGIQKVRESEGILASIRKQLELTDYDQIRERLDYCIGRLAVLPVEREASVGRQSDRKKEEEVLLREQMKNESSRIKSADRRKWLEKVFEAEYKLGYVERRFVITDDMEDQAAKVCSMLAGSFGSRKQSDFFASLQETYHQNRGYLLEYQITMQTLFEELDQDTSVFDISLKRIDISAKYRGTVVKFKELIAGMSEDAEELKRLLSDRDRELFEDILANTISKKIRGKIQSSKRWVDKMNALMESMQTSSGLKLNLRWRNKRADSEDQLDTKALVELLQKDVEIMREEEVEKLSRHFRSKIEEARKIAGDTGSVQSFHAVMREVLDYRKWFEFQLESQKTGEKKKELTDRVFFTFSGGEKAMAMYVPLFSAVVAKYAGARGDAPKLISLDEAFAGVDEMNIRDMFRLMVEFEFNFMINSQILWGDYDTVPGLAIYQLVRPENAKYVTVIRYVWNGKIKKMVNKPEIWEES